jgi:hypothetical protein
MPCPSLIKPSKDVPEVANAQSVNKKRSTGLVALYSYQCRILLVEFSRIFLFSN